METREVVGRIMGSRTIGREGSRDGSWDLAATANPAADIPFPFFYPIFLPNIFLPSSNYSAPIILPLFCVENRPPLWHSVQFFR